MAKGETKNPFLIRGIRARGRSWKGGRIAALKKKGFPQPKSQKQRPKRSKWYPAEDVKRPIPRSKKIKPTRLKSAFVPGRVVILLAGKYMGRRVVFLKQLPSGLLLVTGPFKVNGVPLRRVNQAYTIATSTNVDINGVDVSSIDDAFFARSKIP